MFWYDDKVAAGDNMPVYRCKINECSGNNERPRNNALIQCTDSEIQQARDPVYDNGINPESFQNNTDTYNTANVTTGHERRCENVGNVNSASNTSYPGGEMQYVENNRNYQNTNSVYDNAANSENYLDSCGTIYDNVNNGDDYRERESPYDNAAGPYESFLYPPQDDYY